MTLPKTVPGLCAAMLVGSALNAAPVVFTDRDEFVGKVQPQTLVDYNNVAPVSFAGSSATVGNTRFSGDFSPYHPDIPFVVNFVGKKHNKPDLTIDGTHAVYGASIGDVDFRIDFLNPVTAWGADFMDLGDSGQITNLRFLDDTETVIDNILVFGFGPDERAFWGIDLDGQEASSLVFQSIIAPDGADAFLFDNALYSQNRDNPLDPSPVPLPASALLFLTGGGAFMVVGRRRKRS